MRTNWFIWVIIAAVLGIVFVVFNYQSEKDKRPLSDIFPEEVQEVAPEIEYEFINTTSGKEETVAQPLTKPVTRIAQASVPTPMSKPAPTVNKMTFPQTKDFKLAQMSPVTTPPKAAESSAPLAPTSQPLKSAQLSFTIQVTSSKDKTKAESVLKVIKDKGYSSSYLVTKDLGDKGTWYRIYVGEFATKEQAQELLTKLKENYKDSFIISLQKTN